MRKGRLRTQHLKAVTIFAPMSLHGRGAHLLMNRDISSSGLGLERVVRFELDFFFAVLSGEGVAVAFSVAFVNSEPVSICTIAPLSR